MINNARSAITALTGLGLSLLALGIVAGLLAGDVPFLGDIPRNIMGLVQSLSSNGLVGLISLGVIIWLVRE
jgi:hypothetical protein